MSKRRMLIVDDERDFSAAMATRCRSLGLEVETASNTLTAMTLVGTWRPDVICLDVEMPTGNGLSLCEFLSSDPATAPIPMIILTGRKDPATLHRCQELQAYYLHKSPNLWRSMRPVICELVDFEPVEESRLAH